MVAEGVMPECLLSKEKHTSPSSSSTYLSPSLISLVSQLRTSPKPSNFSEVSKLHHMLLLANIL